MESILVINAGDVGLSPPVAAYFHVFFNTFVYVG